MSGAMAMPAIQAQETAAHAVDELPGGIGDEDLLGAPASQSRKRLLIYGGVGLVVVVAAFVGNTVVRSRHTKTTHVYEETADVATGHVQPPAVPGTPDAPTPTPAPVTHEEPSAIAGEEPGEEPGGKLSGKKKGTKAAKATKAPKTKMAKAAPVGKAGEPAANSAAQAEDAYKAGNALIKENKVQQAIDEYKRALTFNPKHGLTYRSLGVAYMKLGREKDAIASYEKFVQYEPGHKDAEKVRGIVTDYYKRNPR